MPDEYDLIPHRELHELRERVDGLKSGKEHSDVVESVIRLSQSLERLNQIFTAAAQEMKQDEREEHAAVKQLKPLMEKLDTIIEQNQKIAKAIIAVTDQMQKPRIPQPQPMMRQASSFPPPPFSPPSAPPVSPFSFEQKSMMPPSPTFREGPAPEPSEKKRGLFTRFGK